MRVASVWLDHNPRLANVAPLAVLEKIYYLTLDFTAVSDVSAVMALPLLRGCHLSNTNVTTLPTLPTSNSFEYIDLGGSNLTSLGNLVQGVTGFKGNLITLYIDNTPLCTTNRLPSGWEEATSSPYVNCTTRCDPQCPPMWPADRKVQYPSSGCDYPKSYPHLPWRRIGCNVRQCGFDGGDCPAHTY